MGIFITMLKIVKPSDLRNQVKCLHKNYFIDFKTVSCGFLYSYFNILSSVKKSGFAFVALPQYVQSARYPDSLPLRPSANP